VQFRNSFEVKADPDRVYAFLLDVSEVIPCVPGATLTEVVDDDNYRGKVKIKIGAIVMSYDGTARIADRDPAGRSAILRAEGRETGGSGAAAMQAELAVSETPAGSAVTIITDLTITGRAAQFGRGIIEDVSKRLMGQMANSLKDRLEQAPAESDPSHGGADGVTKAASVPAGGGDERALPAEGAPLNAIALLWSVFRDRLARAFKRGKSSAARAEQAASVEPKS
jgi:carbon monoxide dehydrogenase subunit G